MKNDKLENYINQNRTQFDGEIPNQKVWKKIEFQMGWNNKNYDWFWKAAAILFFGVSCYFLGSRSSVSVKKENNAEFISVESYYQDQINEKKELINRVS